MLRTQNEAQVNLALTAIQRDSQRSRRSIARAYQVPETTLRDRASGRQSIVDYRPVAQLLTQREEEVVVRYILDLDSRGFSPTIRDVIAGVNSILKSRGAGTVGKQWPYRFIQRRPELRTRFARVYDYQRARCEDPEVLQVWFRLVANMRAKYGILDCDLWNFDETGFAMGQISADIVVTHAQRRGKVSKIQPGNREWATAITCVSGAGESLAPFLLVQGVNHLASWYTESGLPSTWVVRTTANGWTDNDTSLEWIKHFNLHTTVRSKGAYRMLIIDGHKSHTTVEFNDYCKDHYIIPLCLPAHSSHLTQPLDVGVFGPLKKAYSREVSNLSRNHVTHISKLEFFSAFHSAYVATATRMNIAGGFRGAGLIPHDPEAVISKLDIKLRTPTPPALPDDWESQTPQNRSESIQQSTLVRKRMRDHQGSSPTHIFNAVESLAKGMEVIATQNTLLLEEVRQLREQNNNLSKRRRAKRTRLQKGGSLTVGDAQRLLGARDSSATQMRVNDESDEGDKAERGGKRRCKRCGQTGHNIRTCQIDSPLANESEST